MFKYFISICLLFVFVDGFSQEQKKDTILVKKDSIINKKAPFPQKKDSILNKVLDSIIYKTNYGLRLGVDISKPILAAISEDYSGFEITGDYRIKKNVYVAAEIGFEEQTTDEFRVSNSTSKGNYIRLGLNYNAYDNWLDMNNEVFVGYRYGFSLFEQTLNSYTPNVSGEENGNYFPAVLNSVSETTTSLNAHWSELMIGLKVETLKNLFLGFSFSYKILMSVKNPEGFKTLYAPGFNRIYDTDTGFGFNYTLSYLIPFSKK